MSYDHCHRISYDPTFHQVRILHIVMELSALGGVVVVGVEVAMLIEGKRKRVAKKIKKT